jgi:hypothetical protein
MALSVSHGLTDEVDAAAGVTGAAGGLAAIALGEAQSERAAATAANLRKKDIYCSTSTQQINEWSFNFQLLCRVTKAETLTWPRRCAHSACGTTAGQGAISSSGPS